MNTVKLYTTDGLTQVDYATHRPTVLVGVVLHGPSMFAVKAKIDGVLDNQASSIAFDETSSYWSALKST